MVSASFMQRAHAPLPFRIETSESLLCTGNRSVVYVTYEIMRGSPRFLRGFAHDDVETNAEAQSTAKCGGTAAHLGDLFCDTRRCLSPRKIQIHVTRRQILCG